MVNLLPMVPNDSVSIRWSPKGEKLSLSQTDSGLIAQLYLGSKDLGPVNIVLSKSDGAQYPDRLQGDWNRNGKPDDDSVIHAVPRDSRGKMWSSFKAVVEIPVKDPLSGRQAMNPYPLDFWYVYDPLEPDAAPVIRFSRRGWMQGAFDADSLKGLILLTEMQMDGRYDTLDSWMLALPGKQKELYGANSRSCNDHAWLGNKALCIKEMDPSGRKVTLILYNPGMTREEEEKSRDLMAVDRQAAHSGKSVAFLHDYKLALKVAKSKKGRLLIDFETTWCGPCKQMDQWVYNSDPVVERSADLTAVKVDGDENRDLVKQYSVGAYPTIILLDPNGKESKRVVGYQSVQQMVSFLSQ